MTLAYSDVAVIVPTRGDVPMGPTLDPFQRLPFRHVMSADNSKGDDLAVYARYWAIDHTDAPVILTCDDDVILPRESIEALVAAYVPGRVVANMPVRFRKHYPDSCLVGFGAIFDRDLPRRVFERFNGCAIGAPAWADTSLGFLRECDGVFTCLTARQLVDLPYTDREFASAPDRLWKQPGHVSERARMLGLARKVRDTVPA